MTLISDMSCLTVLTPLDGVYHFFTAEKSKLVCGELTNGRGRADCFLLWEGGARARLLIPRGAGTSQWAEGVAFSCSIDLHLLRFRCEKSEIRLRNRLRKVLLINCAEGLNCTERVELS